MSTEPRTTTLRAIEQDWRAAASNAPHWAEREAEEATRLPLWWWLAAPVIVALTVALSMHWPCGWALCFTGG